MTDKRTQTILLATILLVLGGLAVSQMAPDLFAKSDSELALEKIKAKNKQLRLELSAPGLSAKLAHEARKSIPQSVKDYAVIKGDAIGHDKICGEYNYNPEGIKRYEASIASTIELVEYSKMQNLANREAKKFLDMNKRISREEREKKCAKAWELYGPNGTAIPDYLLK
jgi:hypothetical protein